jgi:hypothetical protein
MHNILNRWKRHNIPIRPEAIPAPQRGNVRPLMPDSGCYPPEYGAGFILIAATENIASDITVLRPGVYRNVGGREEKITGYTMRGKTVEMAVENLDVGTFQSSVKNCFPECLRIDLMLAAAEELDQMMNAVGCAVGEWLGDHFTATGSQNAKKPISRN